jgi:hypothetical protein
MHAWLHLSGKPLEPARATAVARRLAHTYRGDPASADWRHLGRLAGFTNQKPERRTRSGYPPWVTVCYARAGLAAGAAHWLQSTTIAGIPEPRLAAPIDHHRDPEEALAPAAITAPQALQIYQDWMRRWHIAERFPHPDWSIVDLWVARALLAQGTVPAQVRAILQLGSPGFPRRHGNPQDYLRRTLLRAAFSRPAPPPPVCAAVTTCGAARHRL